MLIFTLRTLHGELYTANFYKNTPSSLFNQITCILVLDHQFMIRTPTGAYSCCIVKISTCSCLIHTWHGIIQFDTLIYCYMLEIYKIDNTITIFYDLMDQ